MINKNKSLLIVGFIVISGFSYNIGSLVRTILYKQELLQKGYAEYHQKTGKWQLCTPDIVIMNLTDPNVRTGTIGVTVHDYLKKLDEELSNQRKIIDEKDENIFELQKNLAEYNKKFGSLIKKS